MKFHQISNSRKISEIGHYPQTDLVSNKPLNFRRVVPTEFYNGTLKYSLVLNKDAVPTNLLDRVGLSFGLIMDKSMKKVFDCHRLPPHEYHPIEVFNGNTPLEYYFFQYIWDTENHLDKRLSTLVVYDTKSFEIIDEVNLENIAPLTPYQYKKSLLQGLSVRLGNISFNKGFPKYDIFDLSILGRKSIITDKLKVALEDLSLTGYQLKEFNITISENYIQDKPSFKISWNDFTQILDKLQIASLHESGRNDILQLLQQVKKGGLVIKDVKSVNEVWTTLDLQTMINRYDDSIQIDGL